MMGMRPEVQALLMAGVAALSFDAGMLLMKVRGDRHPPFGLPPRPAVLRAYMADPLWLLGLAFQPFGYGLYLWALDLGPLAVVQPVMSAGIVVFVGCAAVILCERITPLEWMAIAAVGVGLLLLGLSLDTGGASAASGTGGSVALYSAACLAVAAAGSWWASSRVRGVAWGVWSGILLGLGSLWAKGLVAAVSSAERGQVVGTLITEPYFYLTAAGNLVGFAILLTALRNTRSGVVFALSSTLSNLVPILGGMAALGEPLPAGAGPAALRIASLLLTIGGAASLARFDPGARRRLEARSPS